MYISLHCMLCAEWVYTLAAFFKVWNRHTREKYARWRFTLSTRTFSAFWKFHLATRKTVTKDSNETDFGLVGGGRQDAPNFGEISTGGLAAIHAIKHICPIFGTSPKSLLPSTRQTYCKYTLTHIARVKGGRCVFGEICRSIFSTRKSFSSSPSIASH